MPLRMTLLSAIAFIAMISSVPAASKAPLSQQLRAAATSGNLAMAKKLLQARAPIVDPERSTDAMEDACGYKRKKVIELFLESGFKCRDSKDHGYAYIRRVIGSSDRGDAESIDIVKILVERGGCDTFQTGDSDGRGKHASLINHAIFDNQPLIACYLIGKGADVPFSQKLTGTWATDRDSMLLAIEKNYTDVLEALLKNGGRVNDTGKEEYSPLFLAVKNDNLEAVKLLVKYGADVDAADSDLGTTPLFRATSDAVTSFLIQKGASIKKRNRKGQTVLHTCETAEKLALLLPLASSSTLNSTDKTGNTPLMGICESTSCESLSPVVRILIEHHADLNKQNDDGETALMLAAKTGKPELVSLLLDSGADTGIRNKQGYTAYELAKSLLDDYGTCGVCIINRYKISDFNSSASQEVLSLLKNR